jgi:hypothetical protein
MASGESRNSGFLARFGPPIFVIAIVLGGLYIYYRVYGDSDTRFDRAISSCVNARTFGNDTSSAREEATASCLRDTPIGR